MIRSLTGANSSAQSTQESNCSPSQHACRLEQLALAKSKLVQSVSQTPLRLETTNLESKMPIMGHAGGPGAAPEMEPKPVIRSLTGTKSSSQSTQESNESSSEHACRPEKLALARSKIAQSFSQTPLRLETMNLVKSIVFSITNSNYGTRRRRSRARRSPGNGTKAGDSQPRQQQVSSPKHARIR